MPTLRLIDPNGYTVPGGIRDDVTPDNETAIRGHLLHDVAARHAQDWAGHGYDARDYRVLTDPQPTDSLVTVTAYHNQYDRELRFLGEIVVGSRVTRGYAEFVQAREYFLGMADTDYIRYRPAAHLNDKDS